MGELCQSVSTVAQSSGPTFLTLVSLNLTMLHGHTTQVIIAFNHFVRSRSVLVLGRFRSNPNVYVKVHGGRQATPKGMQHNVRISGMKRSVLFLWPGHNLELFDPPHVGHVGSVIVNGVPGGFQIRRGLTNLAGQVTIDQGQVGRLPRCFLF